MSMARIWEKMTVNEVRESLEHTQTVLIPLGVTEQHGYHITLDTDCHNAWQISTRAADRTESFVAPLMPYTFSGGELPGTINIDYHLVALFVTDILRALSANGLQNLIVVLGHGGTENARAAQEGAELFLRQYPCYADRKVAVYRFWEHSPACQEAFEDGDFHAGYFETSMMMYWAPGQVRPGEPTLDDPELVHLMRTDQDAYRELKKPVDHPDVVPYIRQNPRMKVGVMGDPARASAALGQRICEETVDALVDLIQKMEQAADA